ncbi:MAG: bifunctional phosphoribosyl-AMP cyclohydrolase/phosphoribosyl-ATP diphosphatase HisIE [Lachnospiraceae bacterium]|nr:bifunctional phosphoribosyl-AMP cyclohydrolase/phosphoribosyl-ATP diphosphatase HisIE [Lachnospiraceae bacterium]
MKRLIPCIYLYQTKAVRGFRDKEVVSEDAVALARSYEDQDADALIVFDLSNGDAEHDAALDVMKEICAATQIPVIGAGNVKRMEDIKKILYTGCKQAVLNYDKDSNIALTEEVSKRFGKEKIAISFTAPETLNQQAALIREYVSDTIWIAKEHFGDLLEYLNEPTIAVIEDCILENMIELLKRPVIDALSGNAINQNAKEIHSLKAILKEDGVDVQSAEVKLSWSDLTPNADGLIPCIAQDYKTGEVLMLAYMNEESFQMTLNTGRMTYWSRSRKELWCKGDTSGHYQYVKSLTADCDKDTLLAKVQQIGAACHTGARSCFFNEIMAKEFKASENPLMVFEEVYKVIADRKVHPKEGSYTNYLFDKGVDKILKKLGEEATEIVIAAKNPNKNEVKYEMCDFLYHMMVLMVEQGVSWEEITTELANR